MSPNWRLDSTGTGSALPHPNTPATADVSTGTDTDVAIDFDIAIDAAARASGIDLTIVHDQTACRDCRDCRAAGKHCHLVVLYPDRGISGGTTPKGYLAQHSQAGQMGHCLYCVIYRDS